MQKNDGATVNKFLAIQNKLQRIGLDVVAWGKLAISRLGSSHSYIYNNMNSVEEVESFFAGYEQGREDTNPDVKKNEDMQRALERVLALVDMAKQEPDNARHHLMNMEAAMSSLVQSGEIKMPVKEPKAKEPRYKVSAENDPVVGLTLKVKGLEPHEFYLSHVHEEEDVQEEIEMLRLAVKDDVIPEKMYSDCDQEEPSTIYYVGVKHDMSVIVSSECSDEHGGTFLEIVNLYCSDKLKGFFVLTIEAGLI